MNHNKKSDEDVIRELKEFQGDYLPVDKDRLILFVTDILETKNIEPTLDKITAAAFRLFPKKFHLIGFPEYPDGLTIYTCFWLHNTKTKKWLNGSVQSGFKVTDKGRYYLDETKKMLEGKIKITKAQSINPKRKEITYIDILKKTDVYRKYLQNNKEEIRDSEILEALRIPQSSKNELIDRYVRKYIEYAVRIDDLSVVEFLRFVSRKIGGGKNVST